MKTNNKSHFLKIGYVAKTHGIHGEILIQSWQAQASWPHSILELFIGENLDPFIISGYRPVPQGGLFKLRDVSSLIDAKKLKSQSVFLAKKYFETKKNQNIYLSELQGFQVKDQHDQNIGVITGFQSHDFQDLLVIQSKNHNQLPDSQLLIPCVKSYILNIDFEKKICLLNLPNNFLDIFKQNK